MAEFVEKRCEDMIPELEQMERIKLFDKKEIRSIAKKRKDYEYKIQRHTKCKEDYLRYIQYEMDLLKLIKQRRDKFCIGYKKSGIDYSIANRVNRLYQLAMSKFEDDIRFWISYMKFCKQVKFQSCINQMIGRRLEVHRDNAKCWHITVRWELEENKNIAKARQYLTKGLHHHPDSQLLLTDAFKLELDEVEKSNNADKSTEKETTAPKTNVSDEMTIGHKRAYIIYQQAFKLVKDVKFIVELLNIAKGYENTEKLQIKIVNDMVETYPNKALMWDTMARRELAGLPPPESFDGAMETDVTVQSSLRDRITACDEVYQFAVKRIKTEEMWSMYLDCLIEINQDTSTLPNFKKKLLKSAYTHAHNASKLSEKHYLRWIEMLRADEDELYSDSLYQIIDKATTIIPTSVNLWHAKLQFLLHAGRDNEAAAEFDKASTKLGPKALPLWRMRLMDAQVKQDPNISSIFQAAMKSDPSIAQEIQPTYLEWLVLMKGIKEAREVYDQLCMQPSSFLELHKKMASLELLQPNISLRNARRPHEIATMLFGKSNTDVWIDYITFEMKHGDARKVTEIHARARQTLEPALSDVFISEYSLLKANPDSLL